MDPQYVLSLEQDAEALVHGGLVLGGVGLALLQRLDGAELARQPLEQSLAHVERLEHPPVDGAQLPVDFDLSGEEGTPVSHVSEL